MLDKTRSQNIKTENKIQLDETHWLEHIDMNISYE